MMAAVSVVTRSVGGVYADGDGCYGDRFDRVTHVEEVCLPEVQSQLARKRDFFIYSHEPHHFLIFKKRYARVAH